MNHIENQTGGIKKAKSTCFGYLVFLLILVLTPIFIYISLVAAGAMLIIADPIHPVDAVVILSGDKGDRLGMAGDLRNRGYANDLIVTNTDESANKHLVTQAALIGFAPENIFITDLKVDSTLDEALALRDFAQSKGWNSFIVVTDPPHSFRTRLIFRRELRSSGISVFVRPVVGHWFRSTNWFHTPEGWNYMFLEIGKIFNYLVFHY